jgi:phosphatidylglycerophosphate synthase
VIKARFGVELDRILLRAFPFLARVRLHPDVLTALGVAASLLAGAAYASGWTILAGVMLIPAGLFDVIDGTVARSQGTSSSAGAFLDSSMDRLSDLAVFSGIALGMSARGDLAGVALALWALAGAVMTSYTRARAERKLARFEVGLMERAERFAVLILGSLIGWLEPALWIVAIGASVTSVQRLFTARRLLRELDRTGRDPTLVAGGAAEG